MTKTEDSVVIFTCPTCGIYGPKQEIATFFHHTAEQSDKVTAKSVYDTAGHMFKCLDCEEIFRH